MRALSLLISPLGRSLVLKIHFAMIGLRLKGHGVTVQVLFLSIDWISLCTALRHPSCCTAVE